MSKERYNEIIREVYKNYADSHWTPPENPKGPLLSDQLWSLRPMEHSKESFIQECKNNRKFSEKWGLKIEEQKLTEERRYNIWFNNNYETGMERFFNPEQLPDYDNPYYQPTPTKEITITYNGEKVSFYE